MPTKTFKANINSPAGIVVGDEVARIHGSKQNYLMCDALGTYLSGPMSFLSQTQNIRMAGLWTMNNAYNLMIPSTLGTPQAVLNVDPPIKTLENIMKGAAQMAALYGMLVAIG
jgi:hypothetical protein